MKDATTHDVLFLCRPEFTEALIEELQHKQTGIITSNSPSPGLVLVKASETHGSTEYIFEHQRLHAPVFESLSELKPVTGSAVKKILGSIITDRPLWTIHLITIDKEESEDTSLSKRLEGIWNTVSRLGKKAAPDMEKRFRPPHRLKAGGLVLQLVMTREGLWHSLEIIESMINIRPGGISRMKWDPLSPSRSYLKMEEALERMSKQPSPGDKVIDLGAAPGGWTYSFIKRGCYVIAVDHGPMKLPPRQEGWGTVQHLEENGITFLPPSDWKEVDWLIADMLIAPGVALGLLRRWLESANVRQIVCNIKLPQEKPYSVLLPIETMMQKQKLFHYQIKQLYHDRREVTVLAWKA